jgi:hypothetical protein
MRIDRAPNSAIIALAKNNFTASSSYEMKAAAHCRMSAAGDARKL